MSCCRTATLAGVGVFVCLLALPATGADAAGKLLGTVSDTTGSVIPNSTVTARQEETGAVYTARSGSAGAYAFESIPAGRYVVTCKQPGFRRFVAPDVEIAAQHSVTLPIVLSVGELTDVVEVFASGAVDATSSTMQTTLGTRTLLALPVQGRDLRNAAEQLQPGAVLLPNDRGNTVSYNGTRVNTNAYRLEGGDVNNYFNGAQAENTTFPQPENLEEFSILTNANDAKYGGTGGAHVTAVVRSGTNDPHGRAWLYLENQGWAANNWAANRAGIPRAAGSQKWTGGNFGGPAIVPGLYDGRNRTFFFFSYEYTNPSRHSLQSLVLPTAAERAGHFAGGAFPCPNRGGVPTCDVDPAQFSPLAKAVLSKGLLPPGDPDGRFTWSPTKSLETNTYVAKIDQMAGANHRLSGTITRNHQRPLSDDFGSCCSIPGTLPGMTQLSNPHDITSVFFNYVYHEGNVVNTLSVGGSHTRVTVEQRNINNEVSWDRLGVPGVIPDGAAKPTDVGLWVNSWSTTGFAMLGGYYDDRTADTTNISEEFTWIKNRHTVELGYNQRIQHQTKVGNWAAGGQISYGPSQPGSSGNPWADFFLDLGGQFVQNSVEDASRSYPAHSAFVQDRIKLTPRLTGTFGLRWDPNEGYVQEQNQFSVYRPGQRSIVYPNAPPGQLYYGDPGIPRSGYPNKWGNVAPRVSLAYDLTGNGRMAVRAGYGIYSDFMTSQNIALDATLPFNRAYSTAIHPGQWRVGQDPYLGARPFPFQAPAPGSEEAKTYPFTTDPQPIQSFSPDFNSARIHQWNFSLQWEPWLTYVWTFAYVGNRATHLLSEDDINTPVFVPYVSTLENQQARRPDPSFQSVQERYSGLNSRYNALQVSLDKRYRNGLALLASYTLSQSLADGGNVPNDVGVSGYRDVRRRYLDYGPSPVDVRNRVAIHYTYELPWRTSDSGPWRLLLRGWTLGGTLIAQSGFPLTVTSSSPFNMGSAGAYANYAGGPVYGDRSNRDAQVSHWLNRAAFCLANQQYLNGVCVTDPSVGVTMLALGDTTKGFARGPGRFLNNMTLARQLPLGEHWGKLQLRVAAFNVFNHTVLDNPDTSLDSTAFGSISSAEPARSLQLSLRYEF